MEKKVAIFLTCEGWNWSPPKLDTHGLIPPVPIANSARPVKAPQGLGGLPLNAGKDVTAKTMLPTQYTKDKIRMVLNFPQ